VSYGGSIQATGTAKILDRLSMANS